MDVEQIIRETAARYGQDPAPWLRTAQIESADNPAARTGNARGLYQFMPKTWAQYGRGDINDPQANADAAMRLAQDNTARFQSTFGRAPTPGEVYLMHQQGADGAAKLLQNPNAPAADIVGAQAVLGNGGHAGMTAQQFANLWTSKFDGGAQPSSVQAGAIPPSDAAPPAQAGPQPSPLAGMLAALAPTAKPKQPQAGVMLNSGQIADTSSVS